MPIDSELPDLPTPAATEAVVAGAIAAQAAEGTDGHGPVHTHCENCGAELQGPFCHKCGQHDLDFHKSFGHVILEALETVFHFDAKLFRSVVALLFKPGRLTAEFNSGKRSSQMPPFRLYIFVSFIFFLVVFFGDKPPDVVKVGPAAKSGVGFSVAGKPVAPSDVWSETWREIASEAKAADVSESADAPAAPDSMPPKNEVSAAEGEPNAAAPTPAPPKDERLVDTVRRLADEARTAAEHLPAETGAAAPAGEPAADTSIISSKLDLERTSRFLRWLELQGKRAADPVEQQKVAASFKHHVPHMMLACLPIFALFTRFLFRKSGQVYLEHLVLALHFHTFIYFWVLCRDGAAYLLALPGWGLKGWVVAGSNLWLALYPFLMLRRLFANSWPWTIFKTGLLAVSYLMTLALAFAVTVLIIIFFA